jgi:hypothetical protein
MGRKFRDPYLIKVADYLTKLPDMKLLEDKQLSGN